MASPLCERQQNWLRVVTVVFRTICIAYMLLLLRFLRFSRFSNLRFLPCFVRFLELCSRAKVSLYWQPIVSRIWRINWYQYEWPWPLFGERSCQPLCYIRHWISRKPLEIEAWFQRTTNRKWPMANRLVTWLMTSLNPKNRTRDPSTQSPISRKQLEMLFSNNR